LTIWEKRNNFTFPTIYFTLSLSLLPFLLPQVIMRGLSQWPKESCCL
jgi:hypothetical protein